MKSVSLLIYPLIISMAAGCGGSPNDMPELGTVSGTLTLDGKPISGATISFYPLGGGRSAAGLSDEQGNYSLQYNSSTTGAPVGEHEVTITTYQEGFEYGGEGDLEDIPGRDEEIPDKYASEKPKVDVKAGANTINLTLTSD